ncbi:MAG: hypothetical protein QME96_17880, partial [Myxococcota bacterium]|nr:hypothetical protein [Myxococcota bacterium]
YNRGRTAGPHRHHFLRSYFDDGELRGFLEDESREREVIEVSDHFFVHERRPTWAVGEPRQQHRVPPFEFSTSARSGASTDASPAPRS